MRELKSGNLGEREEIKKRGGREHKRREREDNDRAKTTTYIIV